MNQRRKRRERREKEKEKEKEKERVMWHRMTSSDGGKVAVRRPIHGVGGSQKTIPKEGSGVQTHIRQVQDLHLPSGLGDVP
jgi:hypothetical protein